MIEIDTNERKYNQEKYTYLNVPVELGDLSINKPKKLQTEMTEYAIHILFTTESKTNDK